MEFAKTVSQW